MPEKYIIISGSARAVSDTETYINLVCKGLDYQVISLLDFAITQYSYQNDYPVKDDFLEIIKTILPYKTIIFATPVYWYAMSGIMKVFFDRWTDLITINKDLGRKLAGKQVFVLSVGADESLPEGFEIPFKSTASYFKMDYQACVYFSTKKGQSLLENTLLAEQFNTFIRKNQENISN